MKFTRAKGVSFCAVTLLSSFQLGALTCVMPKVKQAEACGVVMDRDRVGIPDVTVTLASMSGSSEARTDQEGRFTFADVNGEDMKLGAKVRGFMSVNDWPIVRVHAPKNGQCRLPIYIVMEPGGNSCSLATTQKKDLPRAEKKIDATQK